MARDDVNREPPHSKFSSAELEELRKAGWETFHAEGLLTDEANIARAPLAERVSRRELKMDASIELYGTFKTINTLVVTRQGDEENDHDTWAVVQALCRRGLQLMSTYDGILNPSCDTLEGVRKVVGGGSPYIREPAERDAPATHGSDGSPS